MCEDQMKALRWLANMFPYTHPAKSETDKMSKCIHLYCEQGANAIQELQITIAGLHEVIKGLEEDKPRWIPVTKRLPKEGEFVLVHGNLYPNKHDGGVIAVSKRMDWNYWQGFGREIDITHWMPLPEPPKEE